jgi:uncharacterized protein (TIGR00297 family)
VGTLILYGSGWNGGAVLAAFFIGSNLVSRLGPKPPSAPLEAKPDRRDAWQVYANGGPAALGALLGRVDGTLGLWVLTASLAAAAADTWATAVGTRSPTVPRLLGVGARVPAGTNGGMTLVGSLAALIGAFTVATAGALAAGRLWLLPLATLVGFAGMAVDSLAGATIQGRFFCAVCNKSSEWRVHNCGTRTEPQGGLTWVNNDAVNLLATALAAVAALFMGRWLD